MWVFTETEQPTAPLKVTSNQNCSCTSRPGSSVSCYQDLVWLHSNDICRFSTSGTSAPAQGENLVWGSRVDTASRDNSYRTENWKHLRRRMDFKNDPGKTSAWRCKGKEGWIPTNFSRTLEKISPNTLIIFITQILIIIGKNANILDYHRTMQNCWPCQCSLN